MKTTWHWVKAGDVYWKRVQGGFVQEKAPVDGVAVAGTFVAWDELAKARRAAR